MSDFDDLEEVCRLREEAGSLRGQVFAAGQFSCRACALNLTATLLCEQDGSTGPDNQPQSCPNGCGPMQRVTEREMRKRAEDDVEIAIDRAEKAETELEVLRVELKGEQERSRHLLEQSNMWQERANAYLIQLRGVRDQCIGIAERAGRATPCDHERGVDEESGEIGCDLPECVCAARRETAARIAEGIRASERQQPEPAKQLEVA